MYCSCLYVFKCPWDRSGRSAGTENSDSYTDRKSKSTAKSKSTSTLKSKSTPKSKSALTQKPEATPIPASAPTPEQEAETDKQNPADQGTLSKPDHPDTISADKLVFIGDSRTEGLRDAVNDDSIWSCLSSMGYDWTVSTGVPQVEDQD